MNQGGIKINRAGKLIPHTLDDVADGPGVSAFSRRAGEVWKYVPGYIGLYKVSSYGAVFSCQSARLLTPYDSAGYPAVGLRSSGVRRNCRVHVLVAEAFHGPRPNGMECGHLDGNRLNNRAENLRWVTRAENERHKLAHQTAPLGEKSHHAKLTNAQADIVRAASSRALSRKELAKLTGLSKRAIDQIIQGRTYSASHGAALRLHHAATIADAKDPTAETAQGEGANRDSRVLVLDHSGTPHQHPHLIEASI